MRTKKEPAVTEESYRLLIDELPGPASGQNASVNIALRYSIPVFFTMAGGAAPKLNWGLQQQANRPVIVASNAGDRRIRLAKLKVTDGKGNVANFGEGLAGYVLGHASKNFAVPANAKGFGAGGLASISGQSDLGPLDTKP